MPYNLPKPLIVFAALIFGVAFIFLIRQPHSVCDSQLQVLQESQAGQIYPKTLNNKVRPPLYNRFVEACKMGNSAGACYELFNLLRKLSRDLAVAPKQCLPNFGGDPAIKRALGEGLELMIQLAWGSAPPEKGLERFGWFETPDLALFCTVKAHFLKIYGAEAWESFRTSVGSKLPGEGPRFAEGQCTNCENLKKASETMGPEDIWVRSIMSLRCDQYL